MVEAGMPPLEAIQSATITNAMLLGIGDVGTNKRKLISLLQLTKTL
jgi:imidazolonepropionase-like amidohydrolase